MAVASHFVFPFCMSISCTGTTDAGAELSAESVETVGDASVDKDGSGETESGEALDSSETAEGTDGFAWWDGSRVATFMSGGRTVGMFNNAEPPKVRWNSELANNSSLLRFAGGGVSSARYGKTGESGQWELFGDDETGLDICVGGNSCTETGEGSDTSPEEEEEGVGGEGGETIQYDGESIDLVVKVSFPFGVSTVPESGPPILRGT